MRIVTVFIFFVVGSAVVSAQPTDAVPELLGDAYVAVCEKIQSCARVEFSLNQIPAEHATVLEAALDGLCSGVYQSVERLALYPQLEDAALACGASLLQLSCDSLAGDRQTDACSLLIDQADHVGLTLN